MMVVLTIFVLVSVPLLYITKELYTLPSKSYLNSFLRVYLSNKHRNNYLSFMQNVTAFSFNI